MKPASATWCHLLVITVCSAFFAGNIHAQQAPPVYFVVTPGTIYNLPYVQGGGPDTPWPSLNFTVGDSTNGIVVTSAASGGGGTVKLHAASNQATPAVWRSIGSVSVYIRGGPGTPYHLQWNCSVDASVTIGSMGLYQTLADTVGGACTGDVSVSVLSYNGPLSAQKSLSGSGTIDGTTSGQMVSNPGFPGVTYSYATGLLSHWIYVAGSNVGGSGSNGIPYVGSASLDYTASFTANIVHPSQTAPTAVIDPIGQVTVNAPITVNGSSSHANTSGASLVAYNWTIKDPGGTVIGTPSGPTIPNFVFPAAGTYSVELTVTDSDGLTGSASTTVVVSNTSLVLKLTLDKPTVAPSRDSHTVCIQTGPNFTAGCPSQQFYTVPASTNTVSATVLVTDGSGIPVPSKQIQFSAKASDLATNGGHHSHPYPPNDGDFEQTTCTTDSNGSCSVTYDANDAGGLYNLTATLSSGESDTKVLTVKLDLTPLPPGSSYSVVRGGTAFHPDGTYGTPSLVATVQVLANRYQHNSMQTLSINDMSLEWGGIFDLNGDWGPPHVLHQTGQSVDINGTTMTTPEKALLYTLATALGFVQVAEGVIHYELP
jgi:hypothetical protein